jgi:hypothetical protein
MTDDSPPINGVPFLLMGTAPILDEKSLTCGEAVYRQLIDKTKAGSLIIMPMIVFHRERLCDSDCK